MAEKDKDLGGAFRARSLSGGPGQPRSLGGWEHAKIAREHFRVGDRVRLSEYGRNANLMRREQETGVVTGFCDSPWAVRVRPDHRKTASSYFAGFWELRRKRTSRGNAAVRPPRKDLK